MYEKMRFLLITIIALCIDSHNMVGTECNCGDNYSFNKIFKKNPFVYYSSFRSSKNGL